MARLIDLDARRAEADQEGVTLRINGQDFELPPELPLAFAHHLAEMNLLEAARCLVGDEDAEAFFNSGLTDKDFEAIAEGYGVDLGEAQGSVTSLRSTTTSSKRTSNASTRSTSAKRSPRKASAGS